MTLDQYDKKNDFMFISQCKAKPEVYSHAEYETKTRMIMAQAAPAMTY